MNLSPVGRAAPPVQVVRSQAALEWRLMMSNGEQLLLTLIIPVALLVGLSLTSVVAIGGSTRAERLDLLVPGIIALAVMSTSFTALAIATGFDRRGEAIKFLGTTPLSRTGLLAAKALAVLGIEAIQVAVIAALAAALGWRPAGSLLWGLPVIAAGTAAFAGLGLTLAGTVRAEATLAGANAIYLVLLLAGGVIIPVDRYPDALAAVAAWLPSAALADGLRAALVTGSLGDVAAGFGMLVAWTILGAVLVKRFFRWTS